MNRGFSLPELLAALALFLVIAVSGFAALDRQGVLLKESLKRTQPEEEFAYRALLLQSLLSHSSLRYQRDPLAEEAPHFFPDLEFGRTSRNDAFSVACPTGDPVPFQKEGSLFRTPAIPAWEATKTVLLAGSTASGRYEWNYARIIGVSSGTEQLLDLQLLVEKEAILNGILQEVEMNGVLSQDGILYWIHPEGSRSPFLGPVESLRYEWNDPYLLIEWRARESQFEFLFRP